MYVLNHFIYGEIKFDSQSITFPQPLLANQTNGPDLESHVKSCQTTFNQNPSFIAVDFYDMGSLLQTVAQVNGVKWISRSGTNGTNTNPGSGSGTGTGASASSVQNGAIASKNFSQSILATVIAAALGGMMAL